MDQSSDERKLCYNLSKSRNLNKYQEIYLHHDCILILLIRSKNECTIYLRKGDTHLNLKGFECSKRESQ